MSLDHINLKKIRKSFGKIPLVTSLPNLVEVQKKSFDIFFFFKSFIIFWLTFVPLEIIIFPFFESNKSKFKILALKKERSSLKAHP